MIKEVLKILLKNKGLWLSGDVTAEDIAHQICLLFPKSAENPGGYEPKPFQATIIGHKMRPPMSFPPEFYENEPKPDESRLLADEELRKAVWEMCGRWDEGVVSTFRVALKAQDAKTASIKDAEMWDFVQTIEEQIIVAKDIECQQRVEGIFEEIESHKLLSSLAIPLVEMKWWQDLKQEGVK